MEGNKLEISGRVTADPPAASYKQISESDVEESAQQRPSSLIKPPKSNSGSEMDGADEQMLPLPNEDKNALPDSKVDVGDVKFTSNEKQNGEAKLDIGEVKSAFVGMTKEELMKYANDPFWVRLRWVLFVGFWLLWLAMLFGAIMIIIAAPKCAPRAPRTWWEQGPLTEVEPEIPEEKLKEIKDNKFKAVIVAKSDDSYKHVNDSTELVGFLQRAKDLELNVIVELQPLSTSQWLQQSENKIEPYSDYYIWANSKSNNESGNPTPPNNWLSPGDSSSAWRYSEVRKQFYYAPDNAPHLNFRQSAVVDEFSNVLRNWIDAGAKGVRLRGVPYLLVDEKLEDDVMGSIPGPVHTDYKFFSHVKTVNYKGIGKVLQEWRSILREHKENEGPLLLSEEIPGDKLDSYLVNDSLSFDLPRRSKVFSSLERLNVAQHDLTLAQQIYNGINSTFRVLGKDAWPLWEYGKNLTVLSSDVLNMMTMLLPGCPLLSYDTYVDPQLLQIRELPSVMHGVCERELLANNSVFAYLRMDPGNPGFLVACNPTGNLVSVNFTAMRNVSDEVTIRVLSRDYNISNMEPKMKIPATGVSMPPRSAIVLSYVPKS